jgi:LemA protein
MRWTGLKKRNPALTALLISLPLLIVAAVFGGNSYARLRAELGRQSDAINAQWAELNGALEERASLLDQLAQRSVTDPALLRETQEARTALLAARAPEARFQANARLDSAEGKMLAARGTRRRPALVHLEQAVRDEDAHIEVARRKYNETLEHFNARLQKFPNNIVARISGFKRNDAYFYTEPF